MNYKLIRSKRRSLEIQINSDGELIVRAPLRLSVKEIETFINKKSEWIERHITNVSKSPVLELNATQIAELKFRAKIVMPQKTEHYSRILNLYPTGVKITSASKRWGSCSGKNGICYSYRIMLLPDEIIDYIVIHELCHIKQKNHGKGFYSLVERYLPHYRSLEKSLKQISKTLPK